MLVFVLVMCCSMFLTDRLWAVHSVSESNQQPKGIKINGTIVDKENLPLIGVTIMVKGTSIGTVTDIDGHFFLDVPDKESVLTITYVGYKAQEITVKNQINFSIILQEDIEALDEVVVVGYGAQKKASVVGAIESVKPERLRVGTSRSMSNNLAGQLAGVIAIQPSGEPGFDNSNFWIRGISSFSGTTSPLVLVDGIERNLNDIDPAEIESFSILKDASASAMYGVRGANGVIIINTKRGTVSAPSIDFRIEQSIQKPTKLPKFIGAADYMSLLNKLAKDDNRPLPFSEDRIYKTATGYDLDLYPDVNWIDAITKDYAYNTRANMTVAGGTPMLRYSLTASVFSEDGIMEVDKRNAYDTGTSLKRYNLRANVDLDLTSTTLLRFNIGGYLQHLRKADVGTDEVFDHAFGTVPYLHPTIYSDGVIPIQSKDRHNPWAELTQRGYYRQNDSKLESLFSVEQNLRMITSGLKAKLTFSFDNYSKVYVTRAKKPFYYAVASSRDDEGNLIHSKEPVNNDGSEFLGHSNRGEYGNNSVYLEGALMYNRMFQNKHLIDALFLYNQRSYDNGGIQPYRNQGIAGRLSYTYDSRYVGEFNFGYNGSENFAKGHRFGFFPSVAVGWLLSEEPFMESYRKTFNKIKFRGSVGRAGNDQIGGDRRFAYITTINSNTDGYNWGVTGGYGKTGIKEGDYGVENLTWETVTKSNLGFELGLLGNFEIQVDLFKENRKNIFMQRATIPTQAGFINNPWANFGKVDNKGVDLSFSYNKDIKKDLFVGLRGSFTYAKNKVIEKDEPESVKGTHRSITGLSVGTLWGMEAERLFNEDDFDRNGNLKEGIPVPSLGTNVRPGDIKYIDRNGDGIINSYDEGYIGGTETPRIVYGFGGNINWKQFDLSFFFQGTGDMHRIIGGNDFFIPGSGQGVLGNVYTNYEDAWNPESPNQDVFWPRLSYSPNYNNTKASTWWKKDMSFLRLKTLEIGYSLPQKVTRKINAKNIRFYASGNNLFYFSRFKLWDPELATNTGLKYPGMKSVMFGLNLQF